MEIKASQVKELYKFFAYNDKVIDRTEDNKDDVQSYSKEVLEMIYHGKQGWEKMLPEKIVKLISSENLFGYQTDPKKRLD